MAKDRARANSRGMSEISAQSGHTPMMKQYFALREEAGCILAYQMGGFFEFYFHDAKVVAKACGLAVTKRGKAPDGTDIPMCGFPADARFHDPVNDCGVWTSSSTPYFEAIVQAGYSVAICVSTNQLCANGMVQRKIVGTARPRPE